MSTTSSRTMISGRSTCWIDGVLFGSSVAFEILKRKHIFAKCLFLFSEMDIGVLCEKS